MYKKNDKKKLVISCVCSCSPCCHSQSSSGERLARVTYTSLDSVNITTKGSQERCRGSSEDSWDLLRRCLRQKLTPPPSRFSHEHVLKALQKDINGNGSHSDVREDRWEL